MKRIAFAATAGLAIVFLTVLLAFHGDSGSTWDVTVKNATRKSTHVQVGYKKGTGTAYFMDTETINPGGQHTFHLPGAWCPCGLSGSY